MITHFLEILFRPKKGMTDSQIRKTGTFTALISILVIICMYTLFLSNVLERDSIYIQFAPISIFIVGIFFGLGLHRLIWGNTYDNSLYISWGKGLISVAVTIGTVIVLSIIAGLLIGFIVGFTK